MSKNVKILENSTEKVLQSVGKIQTNLSNGSKCNWIPADSIPLGTITVTEDGVYRASEDPNGPYYGYSQVNVSGVGNVVMGTLGELTVTENGNYEAANDSTGPYLGYSKVTVNVPKESTWHASSGTVGKDDDGDDAIATVNPETGEVVVEKLQNGLPVKIEVTTPPNVTIYGQGAYMNYDGMVVTAYCDNDEPFNTTATPNGVIPIDQLILPETVPYIGIPSEGDYIGYQDASLFDVCMILSPGSKVFFREVLPAYPSEQPSYQINIANIPIYVCVVQDNGGYYGAVFSSQQCDTKYSNESETSYAIHTTTFDSFLNCYVYYDSGRTAPDRSYHSSAYPTIDIDDIPLLARGVTYDVPVQWNRPGQDTILETLFPITVIQPPSGTND